VTQVWDPVCCCRGLAQPQPLVGEAENALYLRTAREPPPKSSAARGFRQIVEVHEQVLASSTCFREILETACHEKHWFRGVTMEICPPGVSPNPGARRRLDAEPPDASTDNQAFVPPEALKAGKAPPASEFSVMKR